MNLTNKVAVVTGGSEGLGFSIVKKLTELGSTVHIISRNDDKLQKAVSMLSKNAHAHVADVTDYEKLATIAKKIGTVDILINNAGIWLEGSVADNSSTEISEAIDINLKGVIYTTKAFLEGLIASQEAHIINVSSTSGLKGRENQSVYVASKFGVQGFTEALKIDLAQTNIKVSGFYPGGMSTKLFEKAGQPKENQDWMDTDQVAEVLAFMLEQDVTMVLDHVVLNKRKTRSTN